MPLALEAPRGVDGHAPVAPGLARRHGLESLSLLEEPQVLDVDHLGDAEAVVHLGKLYVLCGEPRGAVGLGGSVLVGLEGSEAGAGVKAPAAPLPESHYVDGIVGEILG